jgi:hypothetical protein
MAPSRLERKPSLGAEGNPAFDTTNTADFNRDGKLDVAYVSGYTVNILLGKGDGTFSAPVTTSTGTYGFSSITSGDFNNDNRLNLAGATGGGSILMMLGNGSGSFAAPFIVGKGGSTLIAAVLDADSDLDLVAVQRNDPPAITVLLGNGTGHFPITHTYNGPTASGLTSPPVVRRSSCRR